MCSREVGEYWGVLPAAAVLTLSRTKTRTKLEANHGSTQCNLSGRSGCTICTI